MTTIHENTFISLNRLNVVDLSNQNNWDALTNAKIMLAKSEHLKELRLENNMFSELNCNQFSSVMNMTMVMMSWKHAQGLDLSCLDGDLKVISNDNSERVLPTRTGQIQFHCNANSFERVQYFIAGHRIKNVLQLCSCLNPNVSTMDFSGNSLNHIPTNAFQKFRNLQQLHLKGTTLKNLDFAVIQYQDRLRVLDVSYNAFESMTNLKLLESLQLQQFEVVRNNINNTLEIMGYLNPALLVLGISENLLGTLTAMTFRRFRNLRVLNIESSQFRIIEPIDSLDNLLRLDISHNNLTTFNFSMISTILANVEELYAINCQIKDPLQVLRFLGHSVRILSLAENLMSVNVSDFQALNLQALDLSNMNLTRFDFDVLEIQPKLQQLNLSYNKITELDAPANNLTELYVQGNDLTEIDGLSNRFSNLEILGISENYFSCRYLADILTESKQKWKDLILFGDALIQKHGDNCKIQSQNLVDRNLRAEKPIVEKDENTSWVTQSIIVTASIMIGITIASFAGWFCKRKLSKRPMSHAYDETAVVLRRYVNSEHIYEEIVERPFTVYDQLRFGVAPVPFARTDNHYYNGDFIQRRRST